MFSESDYSMHREYKSKTFQSSGNVRNKNNLFDTRKGKVEKNNIFIFVPRALNFIFMLVFFVTLYVRSIGGILKAIKIEIKP